ncbi:MAG: hypothetical protein EA397_14220 [Deltaproteobacteria bacterium]|nr:MAG: hypothetical protein EA397_14220 [Deltaproteobacteria bacterium]
MTQDPDPTPAQGDRAASDGPHPPEASASEPPSATAAAPRVELDEEAGPRETLWGRSISLLWLGFIIAAPVFILLVAMFQGIEVGRTLQRLREAEGVRPEDLPEIWWIALDPGLLLLSFLQGFILTALLMIVIGVGVFVVRAVALRLEQRMDSQARSRYADYDRDAVLTKEAWSRPGPEPSDLDER